MEFQSTTCSSTFTPVCFVYCSDSPCQNGRVWSLLYSAMTPLMDGGLAPSPHAVKPSSATTLSRARARRPRLVIAAHTAARPRPSQQGPRGDPCHASASSRSCACQQQRSESSSEFCYDLLAWPFG